MGNIKWEGTKIDGHALDEGIISFLGDDNSDPNRIGGTLATGYGTIEFYTGAACFGYEAYDEYRNPCPLDVIKQYEGKMSDALNTVASLRAGAGETDYDAKRDDPDLGLADLYEKVGLDIKETLGKQLRETDDFWLFFKSDSDQLEGFEEGYTCLSVIGAGLRYPIDLESLTVGNWNHRLEEAFKTAAEDLLNELSEVSSVKGILEKCNEYFNSIYDDDVQFIY